MSRLPPLNAIRAFEAAARHASFKRAANELCVTDGAVSRHIAQLESWLGVPLFHRLNRQVVLTNEGRALFSEVSPALSRIAMATSELVVRTKSSTLLVSAPPTFTMRWLIPRLSEFLRLYPAYNVTLTTSIAPVDFVHGGYDLAIRRIPVAISGLKARTILPELRLPVCNPDLLKDGQLATIEDLQNQTLIHTETAPTAWPDWLEQAGHHNLRSTRSLRFEEMYFSVQAASNGLGVAIAPALLVLDEVLTGRLAIPFPIAESRSNNYHAVYPDVPGKEKIIAAFCNWMVSEGEIALGKFRAVVNSPRPHRLTVCQAN